eukprot:1137306-Pelagomonas_calceolata.AAC.3
MHLTASRVNTVSHPTKESHAQQLTVEHNCSLHNQSAADHEQKPVHDLSDEGLEKPSRESACCRCAASVCCLGLVSSQYLWVALLVLCEVPCLLHNTWCKQEEEREEEEEEEVGFA